MRDDARLEETSSSDGILYEKKNGHSPQIQQSKTPIFNGTTAGLSKHIQNETNKSTSSSETSFGTTKINGKVLSDSQQYSLRWNNYHSNLTNVFEDLWRKEKFVDVTLVSNGGIVKAHRVILCASSTQFQNLLNDHPSPHPIIILDNVELKDLQYLIQFMYRGEINVNKKELQTLFKLAERLQIRGLVESKSEPDFSFDVKVESPPLVKPTRLTNRVKKREPSYSPDLSLSFPAHSIFQPDHNKPKDFVNDYSNSPDTEILDASSDDTLDEQLIVDEPKTTPASTSSATASPILPFPMHNWDTITSLGFNMNHTDELQFPDTVSDNVSMK